MHNKFTPFLFLLAFCLSQGGSAFSGVDPISVITLNSCSNEAKQKKVLSCITKDNVMEEVKSNCTELDGKLKTTTIQSQCESNLSNYKTECDESINKLMTTINYCLTRRKSNITFAKFTFFHFQNVGEGIQPEHLRNPCVKVLHTIHQSYRELMLDGQAGTEFNYMDFIDSESHCKKDHFTVSKEDGYTHNSNESDGEVVNNEPDDSAQNNPVVEARISSATTETDVSKKSSALINFERELSNLPTEKAKVDYFINHTEKLSSEDQKQLYKESSELAEFKANLNALQTQKDKANYFVNHIVKLSTKDQKKFFETDEFTNLLTYFQKKHEVFVRQQSIENVANIKDFFNNLVPDFSEYFEELDKALNENLSDEQKVAQKKILTKLKDESIGEVRYKKMNILLQRTCFSLNRPAPTARLKPANVMDYQRSPEKTGLQFFEVALEKANGSTLKKHLEKELGKDIILPSTKSGISALCEEITNPLKANIEENWHKMRANLFLAKNSFSSVQKCSPSFTNCKNIDLSHIIKLHATMKPSKLDEGDITEIKNIISTSPKLKELLSANVPYPQRNTDTVYFGNNLLIPSTSTKNSAYTTLRFIVKNIDSKFLSYQNKFMKDYYTILQKHPILGYLTKKEVNDEEIAGSLLKIEEESLKFLAEIKKINSVGWFITFFPEAAKHVKKNLDKNSKDSDAIFNNILDQEELKSIKTKLWSMAGTVAIVSICVAGIIGSVASFGTSVILCLGVGSFVLQGSEAFTKYQDVRHFLTSVNLGFTDLKKVEEKQDELLSALILTVVTATGFGVTGVFTKRVAGATGTTRLKPNSNATNLGAGNLHSRRGTDSNETPIDSGTPRQSNANDTTPTTGSKNDGSTQTLEQNKLEKDKVKQNNHKKEQEKKRKDACKNHSNKDVCTRDLKEKETTTWNTLKENTELIPDNPKSIWSSWENNIFRKKAKLNGWDAYDINYALSLNRNYLAVLARVKPQKRNKRVGDHHPDIFKTAVATGTAGRVPGATGTAGRKTKHASRPGRRVATAVGVGRPVPPGVAGRVPGATGTGVAGRTVRTRTERERTVRTRTERERTVRTRTERPVPPGTAGRVPGVATAVGVGRTVPPGVAGRVPGAATLFLAKLKSLIAGRKTKHASRPGRRVATAVGVGVGTLALSGSTTQQSPTYNNENNNPESETQGTKGRTVKTGVAEQITSALANVLTNLLPPSLRGTLNSNQQFVDYSALHPSNSGPVPRGRARRLNFNISNNSDNEQGTKNNQEEVSSLTNSKSTGDSDTSSRKSDTSSKKKRFRFQPRFPFYARAISSYLHPNRIKNSNLNRGTSFVAPKNNGATTSLAGNRLSQQTPPTNQEANTNLTPPSFDSSVSGYSQDSKGSFSANTNTPSSWQDGSDSHGGESSSLSGLQGSRSSRDKAGATRNFNSGDDKKNYSYSTGEYKKRKNQVAYRIGNKVYYPSEKALSILSKRSGINVKKYTERTLAGEQQNHTSIFQQLSNRVSIYCSNNQDVCKRY